MTNQISQDNRAFELIEKRLKELKDSDDTQARWEYLRILKELFIMAKKLKSIAEKFSLDIIEIENTLKRFIQEIENYKLYKKL